MSTWFKLIALLPEIIKLLQALEKRIEEVETERKVKEDLRSLKEAIDAKDHDKIKHIFNSK